MSDFESSDRDQTKVQNAKARNSKNQQSLIAQVDDHQIEQNIGGYKSRFHDADEFGKCINEDLPQTTSGSTKTKKVKQKKDGLLD